MRKSLFIICTTLIMASCQSDDVGKASTSSLEAQSQTKHDHSQHKHSAIDVESFGESIPAPTVSFAITADSASGWNIHIETEHFKFAPEKINQDASAGEGHAHIYVDGFKMARVYSDWFHLKKLTPGEHTVVVSLNANDHSALHYQGKPISASQRIQQL